MQRVWLSAAGICGALAVGLAAIAAHTPSGPMVQNVAMLLGWHAPALIGLALWQRANAVAALWLAGLFLFGGAVLLRAFLGISLGPVAPIGGVTLIGGWLLLAVLAWRR